MKKRKSIRIPKYPNGGNPTGAKPYVMNGITYMAVPASGDSSVPANYTGYEYTQGITSSQGGTTHLYKPLQTQSTTNQTTPNPGTGVFIVKNPDGTFTYKQGLANDPNASTISKEDYYKFKYPKGYSGTVDTSTSAPMNTVGTTPTFPFGGELLDKTGQFFGNYGKAIADGTLGVLGMGNVITEDDYKGAAANQWNTGANIAGKIGNVGLKIGANAVVPGSGKIVGAATNMAGKATQQYDEFGNPIMAMGGSTIEVEKQEVMRMPNGSTTQVDGPTHNNGGVDINVPMGTDIFSDRLKHPFTGKTFAKEAAKFKTNKEMKILEDKNSDDLSKKTAKLMIGAKNQNLTQLFKTQEQLKQDKVAKYAQKMGVSNNSFAYGGMTGVKYPTNQNDIDYSMPVYMYPHGGTHDSVLENYMTSQNNFDPFDSSNFAYEPSVVGNYNADTNPIGDEFNNVNRPDLANLHNQEQQQYKGSNQMPWGDIGYGAMAYAPTAYNIGMGLFSKPQQYNAKDYQTQQTIPYRDVNMKPIMDEINVQSKIAKQNIRGANQGTGSYLSNVVQLGANTQRAKSKAMMEADIYNKQNQMGVDQFNIGIDANNKRTALTVDNINAANKAKKSEFLGKGLEGVSAIAQTNKLMSNKQGVDTMKENLLGDFLNSYSWDSKTKSWTLK